MDRIIDVLKGILVVLLVSFNQFKQPTTSYNSRFKLHASEEATASALPSPTPNPPPKAKAKPKAVSTTAPNYEMVPNPNGEKDFYLLKNVPVEPMASVDDINAAVNGYGRAHGLNALIIDSKICDFAKQRATEAKANFSHDGFKFHLEKGDYDSLRFSMMGENLWQGSFSGVHIVEYGWDRSEGHRANLQANWVKGCAGVDETTVSFLFEN